METREEGIWLESAARFYTYIVGVGTEWSAVTRTLAHMTLLSVLAAAFVCIDRHFFSCLYTLGLCRATERWDFSSLRDFSLHQK